jgi:hypothetical protein
MLQCVNEERTENERYGGAYCHTSGAYRQVEELVGHSEKCKSNVKAAVSTTATMSFSFFTHQPYVVMFK